MNKSKNVSKESEKGNALFLILIAVALFAALSYAVTQSGRSSGTIDRETALIAASQITQYPATLETAITRMIITGVQASEVHFDHDVYNSDANSDVEDEGNVFKSEGGGVTRSTPPSNIGKAQGDWPEQGNLVDNTWGYKDVTDSANGYYIEDVGTNDDVSGRDAFAYLHDIAYGVCEQINKGLDLDTDPVPFQDTAVDYSLGSGVGSAGPASTGGSANTISAIPESPFGCFRNGNNGPYDYYHALIKQ